MKKIEIVLLKLRNIMQTLIINIDRLFAMGFRMVVSIVLLAMLTAFKIEIKEFYIFAVLGYTMMPLFKIVTDFIYWIIALYVGER